MNDCPNAEMRDLLPDLLHGRLSATERAAVTAHVAACADCREELELLKSVQSAIRAATPRVDIAYVVNALPKPPARRAARPATARRTWADWRIAAAVTLLAAGGSSVALISRGDRLSQHDSTARGLAAIDTQSRNMVIPVPGGGSATPVKVAIATTTSTAEPDEAIGMSGQLADLDDVQLKALIDEIERMKAVPITEPEPVSIKVDPKAPGLPEGS